MKASAYLTAFLPLCGALVSASATARGAVADGACATPPPASAVEAAKRAFREGEAAYSEGAHERAIDKWQRAYENDCSAHALLLNLATAYELTGQHAKAAEALRRYNERVPDSPYASANHKRIARLEDREQEQKAQAARRRTLRLELERAKRSTPQHDGAGKATGSWLPLTLLGGGVVTAVAGGAVYAEARMAVGDAEEQCGDATRARCADLEAVLLGERARSRAGVGGLLAAAGGGLAAVGFVWLLLGDDTSEPGSALAHGVQVGADLGPDHRGIRVKAHF